MTPKEMITVEKEVYDAVLRNSVRVNDLEAENAQLHKFLEEFNALDVAEENEALKTKLSIQCEANEELRKENQQLKENLEKAEATLLDIDGGWVTDEIRSKVSEYFVYAIGEKK